MAAPQQDNAPGPAPVPAAAETRVEKDTSCYCMGCTHASEYINCCGFMPAPPVESAETQEVRRIWAEVHERMKFRVDGNAKALPYSVDSAFNGTITCARDQVKDWMDKDELFEKLIGKDSSNLSKERKTRLMSIVEKNIKLWEKPTGPIKTGTGHHIELVIGAIPPSQGYYRVGPREDEIIAGIIAEWLGDDCIERTKGSAFAAPVLLVRKEDGSYRLVVDYRRLNKVTVPNKYPAGKVEDILRRMQQSALFSKFDLTNGFLQVMMERKLQRYDDLRHFERDVPVQEDAFRPDQLTRDLWCRDGGGVGAYRATLQPAWSAMWTMCSFIRPTGTHTSRPWRRCSRASWLVASL